MLRRVALVRADVSEELGDSFSKVTRIGELEITIAVDSKTLSSSEIGPSKRHTALYPRIRHSSVTAVKTSNLT
jgi:hypothetical protein